MDPTAPGFTIRFESRDDYVYAYISGDEDSFERSSLYARQVAAECRSRGFRIALAEAAFETQLTRVEMFRFAAELPGIVGETKMAFIYPHLEQHELNILALMIAVERGTQARVFQNGDEAVAWLFNPEKKSSSTRVG